MGKKIVFLDLGRKILSKMNITREMRRASMMAQTVKNPPEMWETWVQSLGWDDPWAEGLATHSSILAWRILMDRGAWWATVYGVSKGWT